MPDTEEKRLEALIYDDSEKYAYLAAFHRARQALWQKSDRTITQCDDAAFTVLKTYFVLRNET